MGSKGAVPYVHRHPKTGHLNYRRRFPEALRSFIPDKPREFVRTLAAHEIGDPGFTERHQAAAIEYDLILARAQKARAGDRCVYDELTTTLIDHLARHYLTTELTVAKHMGSGPPFTRHWMDRVVGTDALCRENPAKGRSGAAAFSRISSYLDNRSEKMRRFP